MLKIEPGEEIDFTEKNEVNDTVRQTWNMLGPLKPNNQDFDNFKFQFLLVKICRFWKFCVRLLDIAKNTIEPLDFTLSYGKSMDKYRT